MCLSVLYYNARSLFPKLDDLRANVMVKKPDVVCIVVTWLSEDISNHEIFLSGYQLQVQRFDHNRHGGGILVYIHNSFSYTPIIQGDPHVNQKSFNKKLKKCRDDSCKSKGTRWDDSCKSKTRPSEPRPTLKCQVSYISGLS